MQNEAIIIHVIWSPPIPFEKIPEFVTGADFGIYQIYGSHPVYGSDVLLYIGRAMGGSFGWRVPQHEWRLENHDDGRLRVHLGRLAGETKPPNDVWERHIELAESLLVYANQPALNQRSGLGGLEPELREVHVCNWGQRGDLLPEVSGLRWTNKSATMPMNIYRADLG